MYNVIFDMDGVIFDSENTLLECWITVLKRYNIDEKLVRDTYIKCLGVNARQSKEIYKNAFINLLREEKLWNIWDESHELQAERYKESGLPLKPGIMEILEYFKSRKIPVGIASSTNKEKIRRQIDFAGLSGFFTGIIGGDMVKLSKPDPEIYLLACREFGFNKENTFAIEDSFNGIRAASKAGIRPVMVPDIQTPDNEMEKLSEVICKDLFEVLEYFKGIEK